MFAQNFQAKPKVTDPGAGDPDFYQFNEQMLNRLMSGVSEKTEAFLECFVKDGKGRVDKLLQATDHSEFQDLRGVLSGITRRMRKLFYDPDAKMIEWIDDEADEEWEGHYFVTEATRQALENYFSS